MIYKVTTVKGDEIAILTDGFSKWKDLEKAEELFGEIVKVEYDAGATEEVKAEWRALAKQLDEADEDERFAELEFDVWEEAEFNYRKSLGL